MRNEDWVEEVSSKSTLKRYKWANWAGVKRYLGRV